RHDGPAIVAGSWNICVSNGDSLRRDGHARNGFGVSHLVVSQCGIVSGWAPGFVLQSYYGYWFTPLARKPPSTVSRCPVTKLAESEARKTAAPTSSSR